MSDSNEFLIFTGKTDMIGHTTKAGVKLTGYIVDGRISPHTTIEEELWDKFDCIIYKGLYKGKTVAVKFDYNQLRSGVSTTTTALNMFKEHNIPIYEWFIDSFEDEYECDISLIVMEQLSPVVKEQTLTMLSTIIPMCFKYKSFMAHGDIKPDNIMYSKSTNTHYLIDYDNVSMEPLMYGYIRTAQTPLYATQSLIATPTIITLKQDLIELILSANSIYYGEEAFGPDRRYKQQSMIWNKDKFTPKRMFSTLYLCALNIDERNITDVDEKLLLHIVELLTQKTNDKLSLIQDMITIKHYTNTQILQNL